MAWEEHFSAVQSMYIAYYGSPAEVGDLIFWSGRPDAAGVVNTPIEDSTGEFLGVDNNA